jgi:hypothetical protein
VSDNIEPVGRNPRDAAAYLRTKFGLSTTEGTLARWRNDLARGRPYVGPPFRRVGSKLVVYITADLDAWVLQGREVPYRVHGNVDPLAPFQPPKEPQSRHPRRRTSTRG